MIMNRRVLLLALSLLVFMGHGVSFAQISAGKIRTVFVKYINLNEAFKSHVEAGDKDLRGEIKSYYEKEFLPSLEHAKEHICKTGDSALLEDFFGVLISTTNSAAEAPLWALGDMYICRPQIVVNSYMKLNHKEQLVIHDALTFGFLNVTHRKEKTIPDFAVLKDKLGAIKLQSDSIIDEVPLPAGWRLPLSDELAGKWGPEGFRYYNYLIADFNGDGLPDEARVLAKKDGSDVGLFVFLKGMDTYDTLPLFEFGGKKFIKYMGIALANAGTYRTACGKRYWDCGENETDEITLRYDGINLFTAESANSFFYWDDSLESFRRIWMSD